MVVVAVAVAAVPRVCRSMWRFRCSFRFVAKSSEANEIHNKRVNDEQGSAAQHTAHSTQHGTARQRMAQHSTAQHSTAQHSTAQHSTAQCLSAYGAGCLPISHVWRAVCGVSVACGMCCAVVAPCSRRSLTAGWALERLEIAVLESMRPQVLPLRCTIATALQHTAHGTQESTQESTQHTAHSTQHTAQPAVNTYAMMHAHKTYYIHRIHAEVAYNRKYAWSCRVWSWSWAWAYRM